MNEKESDSEIPEIIHPKKRAFLAALIENGGRKVKATEAAGISRGTPRSKPWKDDEAYQAAYQEALILAGENLEEEAIRRAVDGVEEPVGWYQGKAGGTVTRYSDTLLIFLMKGNNPQKYAEFHKHSGGDGPPIKHNITVTRTIIEPDAPED